MTRTERLVASPPPVEADCGWVKSPVIEEDT
jgi:hypothetical protein